MRVQSLPEQVIQTFPSIISQSSERLASVLHLSLFWSISESASIDGVGDVERMVDGYCIRSIASFNNECVRHVSSQHQLWNESVVHIPRDAPPRLTYTQTHTNTNTQAHRVKLSIAFIYDHQEMGPLQSFLLRECCTTTILFGVPSKTTALAGA